jgi:putative transposase
VIDQEVRIAKERSGWSAERTLKALGVSRSTYYRQIRPSPAAVPASKVALDAVLPSEREAVISFARSHPGLRHRSLAWKMIDEDVVCVAPSTVYRILSEAGLIDPWSRPVVRHRGQLPARPMKANELWQTDLRYVRVNRKNYYLLAFLDVFSRYVVHHELLESMDAFSVSNAAQAALDKLPEADRSSVRMQSDNGSAFVSAEFARTLARNGVGHHRIHPHTPEQNAFIERFMRTFGEALPEEELDEYGMACDVIDELINWYNTERLHSGIGYVTPEAMYLSLAEQIHQARREKLHAARHNRRAANLGRRQLSLPLPQSTFSAPIVNH